jgi:hypothetical protein
MTTLQPRYRTLSSWLKDMFGEPVRKITVDAGLSCPNRDGSISPDGCIYCNPRGSGTGAAARGLSISRQIDDAIAFFSRRYRCSKFIAYFQSFTNTYADPATLRRLYREAVRRPEVVGLAVGTRPDCIPDEVLDVIEEQAQDRLVWLELGFQSAHVRTLERINRGHTPECYADAVQRAKARNIDVVTHLILGLPDETLEDMTHSARFAAQAGASGVKLHPLYVIRGTALERLYDEGLYRPMTEREALDATIAVLEELPEEIVIHRLTSDPHPEELVAPDWMLDRRGVRQRLLEALEERDVRQGSKRSSG